MDERTPLDYEPVSRERRGILHTPLPWWAVAVILVAVGLLIASVLTTNGVRPREPAYRARCANNLRQIGLACVLYANDYGHAFPDSLATAMLREGLSPEVFICGMTNDTKSPGTTPQEQVAALAQPGHCSFTYVGSDLTDQAHTDTVVAFEDPANHNMEGANVLYADAHVVFEPLPVVAQLVPQLEAGFNPPTIVKLSKKQAVAMYEKRWQPKLTALKDGTWAASLPKPTTQPAAGR